jgi:hypothetical protein
MLASYMQVARAIKEAWDEDEADNAMHEEDEEVLAEVICNETIPGVGVADVSEAPTLRPLCQMARAWLEGLQASEVSSRVLDNVERESATKLPALNK